MLAYRSYESGGLAFHGEKSETKGEKKMTQVIEGKARKPWPCDHTDCRKKIGPGEAYFLWHIAGGVAQRQHQDHGQPVTKPATKKAVTKKKAATKKVAKKKAARKGGE